MDKKVKTEEIKTGAMPSMSENIKTSAMPSMLENIKTSTMPGMSENTKTSAMPSMSENIKTSVMPSMSENIKTSTMPGMSENTKTSTMPGMSENTKTSAMPGISENIKTDSLPEMAKNSKTSALPNVGENGKNDFENGEAQKNTRKFYGNRDDNNNCKEKIIVNDSGDKHYRTIGECFNEGGEAELYHVECSETKKQFVAKIYFNGRKYNRHIDNFIDAVQPNCKNGLMEICDRGFVSEQGNRAYIMPDYSGTKNLFQYLERHTLSDEKITELIRDISESLNIMHIKGYYHRDIKPDNILYDDNLKRPIIIDYGIVTLANLAISDVAVTVTAKGTPGYRPQEFMESYGISSGKEVKAGPKYDFFSLGVVICDIYCSMYAGKAERMFKSDDEAIGTSNNAMFKFPPNLEKNDRMVNLIKALLRYNAIQRAGYKEIMAWLDGAVLEVDRPMDKRAPYLYQFDSKDCHSEKELARAMALSWKKGIEEVTRGRLGEIYKTKLGMEYKHSADKISNIEYDYESITPDISRHAALAEIIALLGKNMAFAWKGHIYEDENGNTDYMAIADELYLDAANPVENKFDELLISRAVKELLYPQIRFVDENSSDEDKQNVDYYNCMKNVEYINAMANQSQELAKCYLAETCYRNSQSGNMNSYIIAHYTNGQTKDLREFIKNTFTSSNIDSAMKTVNTKCVDMENPVLAFLEDYKENDRLKACLISLFGLDFKILDEIKMNGSKTEQILELIVLFAFCDEVSNDAIGIRDIFMQTCYANVICAYIKEKDSWKYIDATGNKKAHEYKKRLDHGVDIIEEYSDLEAYKVFCEFVRNLFNLQTLIQDVTEIFVYDKDIISSGMLLCTQKNGANGFINSAIIAENEKSNMCLVDNKFIIPSCVAELYCKGKVKIEKLPSQKIVAEYSVEATHESVKRFGNAFRNVVGDGIDEMLKQSIVKLLCSFVIALIVVLLGIGLLLSGVDFITSKEFDNKHMNHIYTLSVIIADFVFGGALLLGCRGDLKDAWDNLRLYQKNAKLTRKVRFIDAMLNKLSNAQRSKQLVFLDNEAKEIVNVSGSTDCNVKQYIEKHHLRCWNMGYKTNRSFILCLVGIIGLSLFLFSRIPARKVLGAILQDNIEQAEIYSKEDELLPDMVKSIDKKVTSGVLYITETNIRDMLFEKYNSDTINTNQFTDQRTKYYAICDRAQYEVSKKFKTMLDKIDFSKAEYQQAKELKKYGKDKEAVIHYSHVILQDVNYNDAREQINTFLDSLYQKQQKFIEDNDQEKLNKIIKKYAYLVSNGIEDDQLKKIYAVLSSSLEFQEMYQNLVALQLYTQIKEWKQEDVSQISCKKSEKDGVYYVRVQEERSGVERLFRKYDTFDYMINTYGYDIVSDMDEGMEESMDKLEMQSIDSYNSLKDCLALIQKTL